MPVAVVGGKTCVSLCVLSLYKTTLLVVTCLCMLKLRFPSNKVVNQLVGLIMFQSREHGKKVATQSVPISSATWLCRAETAVETLATVSLLDTGLVFFLNFLGRWDC